MRRTWNSWTYYGTDLESESDQPGGTREEGRLQDELARRRTRSAKAVDSSAVKRAFEQSMASALERAMDLCDVRNERVERVKRALEAGTYRVPARELADKLMKNMLGEYR